jgi:hypothetical protein
MPASSGHFCVYTSRSINAGQTGLLRTMGIEGKSNIHEAVVDWCLPRALFFICKVAFQWQQFCFFTGP